MCYTESIYFSIERGALGIEEVQYRDLLPAICKVSVMTSGDSAPYCATRGSQRRSYIVRHFFRAARSKSEANSIWEH